MAVLGGTLMPSRTQAMALPSTDCLNAFSLGTYSQALMDCALAAQSGNPEAMAYMGGMYYKGLGIKQDFNEAYKWYQQAAALGYDEAEFSMGKMLEKGEGTERDYEQALGWYQKAAAQGNVPAIYNVGYLYGKGFLKSGADYKQAATWWNKAADLNHAPAMYALSTLYRAGVGVEKKDMVKAYMWITLAGKYGVPEAEAARVKMAAELSGEEVAQAGKMMDEWERRKKDDSAPARPLSVPAH